MVDIKTIIDQCSKVQVLQNHVLVYHYYNDNVFLFSLHKENYEAILDKSVDAEVLSQGVNLKDFCYPLDIDLFSFDDSNEKKYETFKFNLRILKNENEIIIVEAQFDRFTYNDIHSTGIFFTKFTNVIDLIDKTNELDNNSRNFHAMMEHTTDFIFFKDAHHVMTASSDTLAIITGHKQGQDLVGKIDYELFPREHADAYYKLEKEIYQGNLSQSVEIQPFVDENGEEGWVDNRKYAIKNSSGDIVGLFGVARIVTENIRNQEKLKKQAIQLDNKNREIQHYLDIAQVLIMALDDNKNVIMINQYGADLLGYTKEEIIGKNFIDNFVPQGIQDKLYEVGEDIINNRDAYEGYINPILAKSGEERLIVWKNTPLIDEHNQAIGILTSGQDITDKVKQDKQLMLQRKQAQIGEMVAMIAHQWRQPLAAIAATTSSLKIKQSLGRYEEISFSEALDNIENYTQHLSKTIDDFRNFLKDDKQKINVNPTDIINSAIDIVKVIFTNRGIKLKTNLLSDVELSVYPNELTQVILSLLTNAQEVIEERKIKEPMVEIETYEKDGKFYIVIKDNAGGIPDNIIDNVFDPYFTTKGELNGTGLGLYMSKTIIEEHCKGHLEVKNSDTGALFLISLNKTF